MTRVARFELRDLRVKLRVDTPIGGAWSVRSSGRGNAPITEIAIETDRCDDLSGDASRPAPADRGGERGYLASGT